jgi:uncharacterized membrane protein (UPF0127 family)
MRFLLPLLCFVFLLAACSDAPEPDVQTAETEEPTIPFRTDDQLDFLREGEAYLTIDIEIAATDSARTRGLMQRKGLPERSGMLFVFDFEEPQSFWMANTPLALDLMFVNADSQIVDIAKYARPLSPDPISSKAPAQYVIEVPAGFTDAQGIIETDRVRW